VSHLVLIPGSQWRPYGKWRDYSLRMVLSHLFGRLVPVAGELLFLPRFLRILRQNAVRCRLGGKYNGQAEDDAKHERNRPREAHASTNKFRRLIHRFTSQGEKYTDETHPGQLPGTQRSREHLRSRESVVARCRHNLLGYVCDCGRVTGPSDVTRLGKACRQYVLNLRSTEHG
jgi:hypothetical protein